MGRYSPGAGGGPLLPLHWGTFNLAFHDWRNPVEQLLAGADATAPLLLPAPGQRVAVHDGPLTTAWWRPESEKAILLTAAQKTRLSG